MASRPPRRAFPRRLRKKKTRSRHKPIILKTGFDVLHPLHLEAKATFCYVNHFKDVLQCLESAAS